MPRAGLVLLHLGKNDYIALNFRLSCLSVVFTNVLCFINDIRHRTLCGVPQNGYCGSVEGI